MDRNFSEYERLVAIREGNHNHDADLYFNARPKLDTKANRELFEAGFNRAWQSYPNEPAHRQQLAKPAVDSLLIKAFENGFKFGYSEPWDALTDEANERFKWYVERTKPPFCDKDSMRIWHGKTIYEALEKATKAIAAYDASKAG